MSKALTKNQRLLLMEAARRYLRFHKGESLTEAWTGLGSVSTYKPAINAGFMRTHDGKMDARISHWWILTEKGAAIVKILISSFTLGQIEDELTPGRLAKDYQTIPIWGATS